MDAQNERFERYNEITFEAYCKAAIDHAIRRGIQKKERRAEMERPLSALRTGCYRTGKDAGLPVCENTALEDAAFSPVDNQPQQVNSLITTE